MPLLQTKSDEPLATVSGLVPAPTAVRCFHAGMVSFVLGFVVYLTSNSIADPDLYGHVRFGQDILRSGSIVQTDPYSFLTQGHPWINHEWLAEVILAAVYDRAGPAWLIGLKVLLALLLFGLAYDNLCRRGLSVVGSGIVVILALVPMAVWLLPVRPQLFTYLFLLLTLLAIEAADRGDTRWLWGLPVLFALWVNLHGGFLAGLALFVAWYLARLAWRIASYFGTVPLDRVPLLAAGLALGLSGLALLCNPQGIGMVRFLVGTGIVGNAEMNEWVPLRLASAEGLAFLGMVSLATAGFLASKGKSRPVLALLFLCTAMQPLLAQRHLPLLAVSFLALSGDWLAELERRFLPPRLPSHSRGGTWLAAVLFSAAAGFALAAVPHFRGLVLIAGPPLYPVRAIGLLQDSGLRGKLVVHLDWSQYAIWHLGPGLQVGADGRRGTAFSAEAYQEDIDFRFGVDDWDRILRRSGVDLALVSKQFPSWDRMQHYPGWALVYDDPMCALFAREGIAAATLRRTPLRQVSFDGEGMYFP